MSRFQVSPSTFSSTTDYTILQSMSAESESLDLPSSLSNLWKKYIRSSTHQLGFVTDADVNPVMNTISAISDLLVDEYLSPEDREARAKTLKLAARIGHLYETDEEFRHWYHEGIDEIAAGHFVTFSENGWSEE